MLLACAIFTVVAVPFPVMAQEQAQEEVQEEAPRFFEARFRSAHATVMVAGTTSVQLWGVQNIEGMSPQFNVSARHALDDALGLDKARCELKKRSKDIISAQCTNSADIDLGLYMLQRGYATVDRAAVYGSVFEAPYIQAEKEAQSQGQGVWAIGSSGHGDEKDGRFTLVFGAALLFFALGAFAMLALVIMKGFQRVNDAQTQNLDMMVRERQLRDKEREIFATMLDSEIKANKSKIEAYMVVYDEMLKDIKNIEKTPKYRKAGDIVQAQPALDRSVFDRNTDKLDILGSGLSSQVIHFYARIKSKPDFVNLEPDMTVEDARKIVQKAYDNAALLNQLSDKLIDLFSQGGYSSEEEF
ncbi:MAG: hypothetical protein R3E13_07755 [Alphaproteobacteria bacterium]